jgi:hypothetical protein
MINPFVFGMFFHTLPTNQSFDLYFMPLAINLSSDWLKIWIYFFNWVNDLCSNILDYELLNFVKLIYSFYDWN